MADLTTIEEKLAEVTGLAAAAVDATKKVEGMLDDDSADLAEALQKMRDEAEETERRCTPTSDELDGFEFLTMTEAGEAGHWAILGKVNEKAGEEEIGHLVDWALPIQERHLSEVREGSLQLAAAEDPYGE